LRNNKLGTIEDEVFPQGGIAMAELEDRILRLEKLVASRTNPDRTDKSDEIKALEEELQADIAPPVDPDTVEDDKGITPKMYRDFDAVAQKLSDENGWTLDEARTNFGNLLANEANK
jgi:hypothetical protein